MNYCIKKVMKGRTRILLKRVADKISFISLVVAGVGDKSMGESGDVFCILSAKEKLLAFGLREKIEVKKTRTIVDVD
jgi:hypothetical protein